jgi:hypothetical protein
MGFRDFPRKGIRGFSVSQHTESKRMRAARTSIVEAIGGRGEFFARLGVIGLVLWGAGTIFLGDHGILNLRALRTQESVLSARNDAMLAQIKDAEFELKEDAGLSMERVMRERYRKSLPNEVVYQKVVIPRDSSSVAPISDRPVSGYGIRNKMGR